MRVGVVGLGKLGLPLLALLAQEHEVVGVDTSAAAVLAAYEPHFSEPGLDELLGHGRWQTSLRFDVLAGCEVVFIIVPTPSTWGGKKGHRPGGFSAAMVSSALSDVLGACSDPLTVVVSSTLSPGTCDDELLPLLHSRPEVRLVYSPFFIALGEVIQGLRYPDFVLYGGPRCHKAVNALESLQPSAIRGLAPIRYTTRLEAEIVKLSLNTYLTMKVSFSNMIAEACDAADADASVVLDAVGSDNRVGRAFLAVGGPYAGPCLPRDTYAMEAWLDGVGVPGRLPEAARRVNDRLVRQIIRELGSYDTVAILGLSYKPGVPVGDWSLGTRVAQALTEVGVNVRAYDPLIEGPPAPTLVNCASAAWALEGAEAVLIATPLPEFSDLKTDAFVVNPWGVR
jgi:UDPglucose 6-dehydrogenase